MSSIAPMVGAFGMISVGLNVLQLAAVAAGLVVSLRYRWLSDKMWLVVAAFAALCTIAGVQVLSAILSMVWMMNLAQTGSFTGMATPSSGIAAAGGASALSMAAAPFAWGCLVVGLALVLRDVCERLRGLRELLDERQQRAPGAGT
jgi:hypothetical protein